MNRYIACIILLLVSTCQAQQYIDYNKNGKQDIFEDANKPISERVEDLLSQMSFEEKQGQLLMDLGWQYYQRQDTEVCLTDYAKQTIKTKKIGSLWGFFRADTWSGKTMQTGLTPALSFTAVNQLQRYIIDSTRLGIPLFIAEESMHGIMQVGSTVYPTALAQAASWNTSLVEAIAHDISSLACSEGINICFGPMVDISRDARWSRVEETFGEDTYLCSQMGSSFVKGLTKDNIYRNRKIISCLKHFAAYGIPEGGHNGASAHIGLRELNNVILPPFKASIDAGAKMVMTSYNDIDGVPCTMNEYLLKTILRDRWSFDGIVVSDLHSISGLLSHGVAKDLRQATQRAINAGVDIDLSSTDFYNNLSQVDTFIINQAVRRVLYQKFSSGLMDHPFVASSSTNKQDSLSLEIARQSIVLLENKNQILPLDSTAKQVIALIGPNSDNVYNMLGDYTGPNDTNTVITIKNALHKFSMDKSNITFLHAKGCGIKDTNTNGLQKAIDIAKQSDIIILCLGESSSRYSYVEYQTTGAAKISQTLVSDITAGEGYDRSSLFLPGLQKQLLDKVKQLGKPIITVLVNSRPLVLKDVKQKSNALLECFYPGCSGGQAIIETIFGKNNPSACLPISFPSDVGALPCYYQTSRTAARSDYLEGSAKALYPFGYGLSYSTFEYNNLMVNLQKDSLGQPIALVSVEVTNTSQRPALHVVQTYIGKTYSNYITSPTNLAAFTKTTLQPHQTKTITLTINSDFFKELDLSCTNKILSKGEYQISINQDAYTPILTKTIIIP